MGEAIGEGGVCRIGGVRLLASGVVASPTSTTFASGAGLPRFARVLRSSWVLAGASMPSVRCSPCSAHTCTGCLRQMGTCVGYGDLLSDRALPRPRVALPAQASGTMSSAGAALGQKGP